MDFESYGELSDGLSLGGAAVQYDLQLIRKSDLRTTSSLHISKLIDSGWGHKK
jgi:hypothetical protein